MADDRRTNAIMRSLVEMTRLAIARDELQSATECMVHSGVPLDTVRDILRIAQDRGPVEDWPELCDVVMPQHDPADTYKPFEGIER